MQPDRRRPLALDLPLALGTGLVSWAAAQVSVLAADGTFAGGRYGGGPRSRPDDAPPAFVGGDVSWVIYPCLLLMVGALAVRRVRPRASFVTVVVAVAGYLAAGGPYGPVLLAPALALYALATALPPSRWAPLTLLLVPMLMARNWDAPYLGLLDETFYRALVTGGAVMVVPALLGLLRRNRRETERQDREQELRRYAYEERLQIAREVHDVVGHSLSVINLQAGVALHVLDKRHASVERPGAGSRSGPGPRPSSDPGPGPDRPDEVAASLQAIRTTSREALAELRTTLAVFRDPAAGQPLAPRPGLARLDDLVAALRAAGREVQLEMVGVDVASLPAAVDQAAFRITQEALTNVVRHAGGAPAVVSIRQRPRQLRLEVSDSGPALTGPVVEGGGIRGMRERAEAVGGRLTVGRTPAGAVSVQAELPATGPGEDVG